MGAEIVVEHGYMVASLPTGRERLRGARILTDMVTVTGTENLLMAAALAEGETVLENAAQEPEIADLAEMLIAMGAKIEGHGSSRIHDAGRAALDGLRACGGGRPHRGRHLPVRGGGGRRRGAAAQRPRRPSRGGDRQAARRRLHGAGGRRRRAHRIQRRGEPQVAGLPHHRIPGLPDRHAGAVHGAELRGARRFGRHRNHLRKPLHARQRAGAPGRGHPRRRQDRDDRRRGTSCRAPR